MIKGLFEGKRWAALWKALPDYYIPGFIMTLKIAVSGLLLALILGVIFGSLSSMRFKPARIISRIYVEFIQNTPLALQVLFYYSVLPIILSSTASGSGIRIPKFVLGVIGVGIYHGAYISEVIRTGIEAIPKGQSEAAASQGFSYLETMYYIILPQTVRIIMPPLANQALNLVKKHLHSGYGGRYGSDVFYRFLGRGPGIFCPGVFNKRRPVFYHLLPSCKAGPLSGDPLHASACAEADGL